VKFGVTPVSEALGAVLAHGVRTESVSLKKGARLDSATIAALRAAGIVSVVAARLEPCDVGEDEAATILAGQIAGANLRRDAAFTGRVNMFSEVAGLLVVDAAVIAAVNGVDEAITVATLTAHRRVAAGDMVATVKIIPFAAERAKLDEAMGAAPKPCVAVAQFRPMKVGVVSTLLPGLKPSIVTKTLQILEGRLAPAGATIASEKRVAHETAALSEAIQSALRGADLLIVFGASAISDRRDVIPAAIEAAGGKITRFGMPVDPGNLLLLGEIDGATVIGAPGCARSPKENGFDWVLERALAGVPMSGDDIRALGVGGLLMEIATRPQPRLGRD
jgi:molybdenum cofactor cytidylyltransferase